MTRMRLMAPAGTDPEPETSDVEQLLAAELAAFDEALASGNEPQGPTAELSAEARQRLQRAQQCLQVLYAWRSSGFSFSRDAQHEMDASELVGATISHYEIRDTLGRGGMGIVYRARDLRLDRHVALKFLPSQHAADVQRLERFRHEARTVSALNHPHICTLHDIGEFQGCPFLVMELIEGQTLRPLISARLPSPSLARIIAQAAEALRVAHAHGIVHRDIKPENIMLRHDGYVKVLDFGLARLMTNDFAPPAQPADGCTASAMAGTVRYMSPEQCRGNPIGSASDIFSLGVTFYELATSHHPFEASSLLSMMHAIETKSPLRPGLWNADLPAGTEDLILQMLEKEPCLRPTSDEVEAILEQLAGPSAGRPVGVHLADRPPTVGRQAELARLHAAFAAAVAGQGGIVCVSGEPGIGKTRLVEEFLTALEAAGQGRGIARGRCSERLAGAEAYLPILEVFEDLLRGDAAGSLARLMKVLAPTWYAKAVPSANLDNSPAPAGDQALSQEQLKRECVRALEAASRIYPLVLFIDDVHWSDPSTVDLLAYLGPTCASNRLLIVVTFRPTEMLLSKHPFGQVQLEMQTRGICREIPLNLLAREDVGRYLELVFPKHRLPPEFVAAVYHRTEGNPLFMVDLLRYLQEREVVARDDGHWVLSRSLPDLELELPESTRSMIQKKVEKLSESDHRLLAVASVQGYEFDTSVVARVLNLEAGAVEERFAVLDRVHDFIELNREHSLPDGTLNVRYRFIHVLYQNALYASLAPTVRVTFSATVAGALLEFHGDHSRTIAAELALLLEAARDYSGAAHYCQLAAENAVQLLAHQEAVAMTRRGLDLLEAAAPSERRTARQLGLQLLMAGQLQATLGFARPEVGAAYARARQLCEEIHEVGQLFPVYWGLWAYHAVRAEYPAAEQLAGELFKLANCDAEREAFLPAHHAMGVTQLHVGQLIDAQRNLELGWMAYDPERYRSRALSYGHHLGSGSLAFGGLARWLLGFPDQALTKSYEALEIVRDRPARAHACYCTTVVHQLRGDFDRVMHYAEELIAVTTEHGFPFWRAGGLVLLGWARCQDKKDSAGLRQIREGLAQWQSTGAVAHRPYHLGLLAEALARSGQVEQALQATAEGLDLAAAVGECFYEAELLRLQGELLLAFHQLTAESIEAASTCFRRAATLARQQGNRSFELRSRTSLYRLVKPARPTERERQELADVYAQFTEGLETADLQTARDLLT